ncbi:MAG: DUF6010 family protein [Pseudomonadota bacterium]
MAKNTLILSRLPVQSGVVLGIIPLPIHFWLSPELSHQLAAITLVLIAGVYIGYAFRDGRVRSIVVELSTAVGFAVAAWVGINGYPSVIIAALALHGCWDVLHNNLIDTDMPRWYIPFCAVVDWVMAVCLFMIWNFGA